MTTLRFGTIVMTLTAALAALGAGCGGSSGSGGGGGNATTGAGGGGGGSMAQTVNGCSPSSAKDMTSSSDVKVTFPGSNLRYTPSCFKIKKGSKVTFSGPFAEHPLTGGTVDSAKMMHPDSSSPIKETKTGTTATFTFPDAGTFGFLCEFHFALGMDGAVIVE